MTDPDHEADEDEALAEALADKLVELAKRPGVLRLAALQMAGLLPPPGQVHSTDVARALGLSRHKANALAARSLAKLQTRLIQP